MCPVRITHAVMHALWHWCYSNDDLLLRKIGMVVVPLHLDVWVVFSSSSSESSSSSARLRFLGLGPSDDMTILGCNTG